MTSRALAAPVARRGTFVVLVAALSVALPACDKTPDVLGKTIATVQTWVSWRFASTVDLGAQHLDVAGAVSVSGETSREVPDLYATVKTGKTTLQVLRRGGKVWARVPRAKWRASTDRASLRGVPGGGPLEFLRALTDVSVTRSGTGWLVSGRSKPEALGLTNASGRIPVKVTVSKDFVLQQISVPQLSLKLANTAGATQLRSTTTFSRPNDKVALPAAPKKR